MDSSTYRKKKIELVTAGGKEIVVLVVDLWSTSYLQKVS